MQREIRGRGDENRDGEGEGEGEREENGESKGGRKGEGWFRDIIAEKKIMVRGIGAVRNVG